MGISQFFTMERMTGAVLIASFISFAIGGTLPAFHYLPPVLIGVLLVLRG